MIMSESDAIVPVGEASLHIENYQTIGKQRRKREFHRKVGDDVAMPRATGRLTTGSADCAAILRSNY
jgi:hypothetical protein